MVFIVRRRCIESLTHLLARLIEIPIDFLAGFLRSHFGIMEYHAGIVFRLLRRLMRFFARLFILAGRAAAQNKPG